MSYIVEKEPKYYTEWQKLNTFKDSIKVKELQNIQEIQVIHDWDLKTFQKQLRTLEVVHQDDFGIINFSKYSAKYRTRFNPRTTTLAIQGQTHEHIDDAVSECDTFDSEIDKLQARRQNSDQYEKKKGTFKK